MAYNTRYRIEYYRKSRGQTTIDILEKDYLEHLIIYTEGDSGEQAIIMEGDAASDILYTEGIGITSLKPVFDNPLEVFFDAPLTNIFKPTVGSGALLRCIAPSLSMLDLFTDDPQKYLVKIYNGVSGSTLMWQGFINAEIYNEDYSSAQPRPITIYCNDGLQVLDNLLYKESDGSYYTGNVTLITILNNIFDKLGYDLTYIYTSNDIVISEAGDTNPFLYLKLANENFVDEKGVAWSCRKVLDSIFGGLGLVLSLKSDNIYIIDPINLHDTGKGKRYDYATGGNETVISSLGGSLDISDGDISWGKTGSRLDIIPSISEAVVKYDPYNFNDYKYDFSNSFNWSTDGSFVDQTGYYANYYVRFTGWTSTNVAGTNFIGIKEDVYTEPVFAILLGNSGHEITHEIPRSNITQGQNLALKISFEVYVQTYGTVNNIWEDGTPSEVFQVKIPISVQIGDQYWNGGNQWNDESSGDADFQELIVRQAGISNTEFNADHTLSVVNDVWTTASIIVPLIQSVSEELINGNIIIGIQSSIKTAFDDQILPATSAAAVTYLYMKDPRVECVDYTSGINVGNEGVEKRGFISTNLTGKKDFTVETTCGTGTYGCSRGAFKTDQQVIQGTNIEGLYRGDAIESDSEAPIYTTSELILQSVISQYKQSRFKITGTLDVQDYLLGINMKLIQDSDHLTGKSFYIAKGTYNDRYETMEVEMIELEGTRDTF